MVQQPSNPNDLPADFDHHIVMFPTRSAGGVPSDTSSKSAVRTVASSRVPVRRRVIRQVIVIEVAPRLCDVVVELDRAVQLALSDGPRGVVCDLSAGLESFDPIAVEVLATAGRHVRDWPGIPVAVACPDPKVREALRAHPLGERLIVTASLFSAISAVLATPALSVEHLRLAPHPTAPRASREFITRTLTGWRLSRVVPFASLVVSELVASSSMDAGTDIDLSVVWDNGAVRVAVRDHGPGLAAHLQPSDLDLHGRHLTVVAGLSRAFGVLPTTDGGKMVWAVLDAPRPRPSSSPRRSARERQEALILEDVDHRQAKPPLGAV